MKRFVACASLVAFFAVPSSAVAQDAANDAETAQRLFEDAKQLIMQGSWAEACPKLARSNQLDPRGTTLFRLAECYEHTGKNASARSAYLGAASAAAAAGETKRAEFAQERAKRLDASTPYLVVAVNQRPATVYKDGERLDESTWGARIPIDAGEHVVTAEAPGKQTFVARVFILDAATTVLTIPPLLDAPPPGTAPHPVAPEARAPRAGGAAATPPPPGQLDNPTLRKWGLGVLGVGVISAGVGATIALTAPESVTEDCVGTCATGTGVAIGGAIVAAAGLALFIASFGDGTSARPSSRSSPLVIRF